MTFLYAIHFLVCLLSGIIKSTDGQLIAEANATVGSNSATSNGSWTVLATCIMATPNVTYSSGEAFLLYRSGVPFEFIWHSSLGTIVNSDHKWHVVEIGPSIDGNFSYHITFSHSIWLAGNDPTGACALYIGGAEAMNDAMNGSELTDTPADPLIATTSLEVTKFNSPNVTAKCVFFITGIGFGMNEIVMIINYTIPVQDIVDNVGRSVMVMGDDQTWSKSSYPSAGYGYVQFGLQFVLASPAQDLTSAMCYMYTAAGAANMTSSMELNSFLYPSVPTGSPTLAFSPPTTVSTIPFGSTLIMPSFGPVSTLTEVKDMRNKFEHRGNIWQRLTSNVLRCARYCRADPACYSVFFEDTVSRCTAHSTLISSGANFTNIRYFVMNF